MPYGFWFGPPSNPRSNCSDAKMATDILIFIRTSPVFPFAGVTAMLALLIFWMCRRPVRDVFDAIGRIGRVSGLMVLWGFGFYKLFIQP